MYDLTQQKHNKKWRQHLGPIWGVPVVAGWKPLIAVQLFQCRR